MFPPRHPHTHKRSRKNVDSVVSLHWNNIRSTIWYKKVRFQLQVWFEIDKIDHMWWSVIVNTWSGWTYIFLIVPDRLFRFQFQIYNTSIAYSRKIEYGNNWYRTVAIMRTLLQLTEQLEIEPENIIFRKYSLNDYAYGKEH